MRLINLTFKKYPAKTADAIYVRELSKAFSRILGKNYLLVALQDTSEELEGVSVCTTDFFLSEYRSLLYFFWIPYFVIFKEGWGKDRIFFSADRFLMLALIFWRKVFLFKYTLCVDWHSERNTWKEKFVLSSVEKNITTTKHLRKRLISKYGIKPGKIKVVYGGFNPSESVVSRDALGLPLDKKLMGYVGFFRTLGMEKGLKTMIESMSFCQDDDLMLVAVGGSPEEITFYTDYARKLGVLGRCLFKGRVSTSEVLGYQKVLDVLVIPYPDEPHFRDYGFPMKVYEYMASGTPIIYSRLEIIDEVLKDFGISFKPGDPEDLMRSVSLVINNKTDSDDRSKKALKEAAGLTWDNKAEKIIRYINE